MRTRLANADPNAAAGLGSDTTSSTGAAWSRVYGAHGKFDGNSNTARLDRSTAGFLIGADKQASENVRLGVLAGYSHSSFDLDARRSSAKADNLHLGLYSAAAWDAFSLSGGAAYSWHDVDTNRSIDISQFSDRLSADYDAHTFQIFGEAAWTFDTATGWLEPFVGLAHVRMKTNSFTEKGGPAALSVNRETLDTTFTTLGLRAASKFERGNVPMTFGGALGWRHAFGDRMLTSQHAFSDGNAFSIAGVPISKNVAVLEAGLKLDLSSSSAFGLSYYGHFGSDSRDHGLNATLNIRF